MEGLLYLGSALQLTWTGGYRGGYHWHDQEAVDGNQWKTRGEVLRQDCQVEAEVCKETHLKDRQ